MTPIKDAEGATQYLLLINPRGHSTTSKELLVPIDGSEASLDAVDVASILEVAAARRVDMIVMGTGGSSDIRGLVLGSVADKVAHGATCRVIMVK